MNPGSYEHEICIKRQLICYNFRAYQYLKSEVGTKVPPFLKTAHKCEFNNISTTFLSHKIDHNEIQTDPVKRRANEDMRAPSTVPVWQHIFGMVNHLGKFIPNVTNLTQPLKGLFIKGTEWLWHPDQREAFTLVTEELATTNISRSLSLSGKV